MRVFGSVSFIWVPAKNVFGSEFKFGPLHVILEFVLLSFGVFLPGLDLWLKLGQLFAQHVPLR